MTTLTAQSVFDDTVRHLKGMKHRSMGKTETGTGCAYLSDDGCRCAVGAHLTLEEILLDEATVRRLGDDIDPKQGRPAQLDDLRGGTGVDDLVYHDLLPVRLIPHQEMLRWLQSTHDNDALWLADDKGPSLEEMGIALLRVAKQSGVNAKLVNELFGVSA